jgi:hypothetical protein
VRTSFVRKERQDGTIFSRKTTILFEKDLVKIETGTMDINGVIRQVYEEKRLKRDPQKTLHIGSKYDTIVPYESSVSQRADTRMESESVISGNGGHGWQLFSKDVNDTLFDRISKTIVNKEKLVASELALEGVRDLFDSTAMD